MSRREFELVVAQASKLKLKSVDLSSSVSVPAGQSVTIDFFSSVATIGEVKTPLFYALPPAGATSGDHTFYFSTNFGNLTYKPVYAQGTANYNANLNFDAGVILEASLLKVPTDLAATATVVGSAVFDSERSWRLTYFNNTNVAHTSERKHSLIYQEREIR